MNHAPTSALKQIICIKWGTAFEPRYVNILHSMVARNITGPFQVHCFTDDPAGIRPEVLCHPLPELGCEIPPGTIGKWKKSALWGASLPDGVNGVALFLDLDSVIVGNIDGYFTHGEPDDVITARNWARPLRRLGQTSVFRFRIGAHPYMLENLRADPGGISKKYQFEQHYVTHGIRGGIKFWPESWTRHFRLHCLPVWPLRYFKDAVCPKGAKIVTFPGGPNPPEVLNGIWCPGDALRGPLAHIKHAWSLRGQPEKKWIKELRSYVRAVPWVKEHWRE